jgi:ribosome recycling factor
MIDEVLKETDSKMQKSENALVHELSTIRTGRASPALVEHIKVDYHGVPTPIKQMASITTPEAKTVLIQPWDRAVIRDIEKAILKSDLNLNPITDSVMIRIIIPALTEERRKELIKAVQKRVEDTKVALRNIRRDHIETLRQAEKNKEISQDQCTKGSEQIQRLIDKFTENVIKIGQAKEAEIMEI